MAPEQAPLRHVRTTRMMWCECGTVFEASVDARRQRCDECRETHRLERIRGNMAAMRARARGGSATTDGAVKRFALSCGHTVLFRVRPQDGEDLYCCRCQEWREYISGAKRPLCDQRIHRLTPFQTVKVAGRKLCRRCLG